MRTVSFVEHLEFEYKGNIFSKAVALGDVDNDQKNELLIGNVRGSLHIHKGSDPRPWRTCTDLGMITCLEVGDVLNQEINYVIVLNAEGWCYIFHVKPDPIPQDGAPASDDCTRILKPIHKQHLTSNTKTLLIADIDGDGRKELVIGFTDRKVKCYRWMEGLEPDFNTTTTLGGKFTLLEAWQLAGQLGSMTVNKCQNGSVDLMVSQPGGTFVTLLRTLHGCDRTRNLSTTQGSTETDDSSQVTGPSLQYHPLGTARAHNPAVTTEVVGNINRRRKVDEGFVPSCFAICTLDGTLTLIENSEGDDKILWSVYVDHQLFTLTKLDVTGDGTEEVVACSWDGQTYIVNLERNVVRFPFQENVAAFCAGYYALSGEDNTPCLIYATFDNKVHVYYNIKLSDIGSTNLIEAMEQRTGGTHELLSYFNVDVTKRNEIQQLYRWCLYGNLKPPNG